MSISVFKMLSMLCPATGYPAAQLSKFACFAMFYENLNTCFIHIIFSLVRNLLVHGIGEQYF